MQSKATTVAQYLKELPEDRREAIKAIREVILKNLPKGFEEGMQYGMIGYYIPHKLYPNGYHCDPKQPLPFASLASQKNHMALYTMAVYADPKLQAWFTKAWKDTGQKLDMGKSCIRFKKIEAVPLNVIAQLFKKITMKQYIDLYEGAYINKTKTVKKKTTKKAAKKTTKKVTKKNAKKTTKKKTSKK